MQQQHLDGVYLREWDVNGAPHFKRRSKVRWSTAVRVEKKESVEKLRLLLLLFGCVQKERVNVFCFPLSLPPIALPRR